MNEERQTSRGIGLLCALPEELGGWGGLGEVVSRGGGFEVRRVLDEGWEVFTCVSGVGKVCAARAAEALLYAGAKRGVLVVGTCGALTRGLDAGSLVHCGAALQADLAIEGGMKVLPDVSLLEAWEHVAEGHRVGFLTADRPVMSPWRRWRAQQRVPGPCVADMETAAVGATAEAWGVPWAALRSVTDHAGWGSHHAFRKRYPVEAGRAADTVKGLLAQIRA
jgi:nucleoside phosphorylase